MSLLSDLGTKIGAEFKAHRLRIENLENNPAGIPNVSYVDGNIKIDVSETHETKGSLVFGRRDGTDRTHEIAVYNSSTKANNYIDLRVHNGTVGQTQSVFKAMPGVLELDASINYKDLGVGSNPTWGTYVWNDQFQVTERGANNSHVATHFAVDTSGKAYVGGNEVITTANINNYSTGGGTTAINWIITGSGVTSSNGGRTLSRPVHNDIWDSQAYSDFSITSGAYFSCRLGGEGDGGNNHIMIGLNEDPTTNASYTSIDYCIYFDNGEVRPYENGAAIGGTSFTWNVNSVYSIEYTNSQIIYRQDGVTKRTVNTSSGRTFFVDSSFHSNVIINDINFFKSPNS
jgi:hypothetical protein